MDGSTARFPVGNSLSTAIEHALESCKQCCSNASIKLQQLTRAFETLEIRGERKDEFDLVIAAVDMPGIDAYKLMDNEMKIPVVMVSADERTEAMMKGGARGPCGYLPKAVRMEDLKLMWQHVFRMKPGTSEAVLPVSKKDD